MSQTEFKRRLQALMNKPENQVCSDCPERQPRWASLIVPPGSPAGALPIGAFCCLECSGSHRRLGVHISFVRSVNLDSWKEREVQAMEQGGNKKVNEIWEAKLSSFGMHSGKPQAGADGRTRERYIRDKYERRKFFDPAAMQRFYSGQGAESSSEEESSEEESDQSPPKKTVSGKIPAIRAPSDAAKKRAESRKARLDAYRSSSFNPPNKISVKAAKPKPPPQQNAEVVDLLDFASPMPNPGPPPDPPSHPVSPSLDLFSDMTISPTSTTTQPIAAAPAPAMDNFTTNPNSTNINVTATQPKKFDTNEILSMFNTPNPTTTTSSYSSSAATNAISNMFPTQAPMMMQQQQRPQTPATSMMMMQSQGVNMYMVQQQNQMAPQQQQNMMMMQTNPYMQGYATTNANNVMNAAMSYNNNNVNLSIGVTASPAMNSMNPSSSSIMAQQVPMGGFARQSQPGLNIMGGGSGGGSAAKTDTNGFPLYEL